jgi:hypothetical protein
VPECKEQGTPKLFEPAQEQAEVVAGSGEHGVSAVAIAALEIIVARQVVALQMADDRLDGSSSPHLPADGFRDAADLAADPDPEPVGVMVAAIAFVDMDAANLDANELFLPPPYPSSEPGAQSSILEVYGGLRSSADRL